MRTLLTRALAAVLLTTAALAVSTPAQAAWGPQAPFSVQSSVNGNLVGSASGWVQFDTDGSTFRYEVTACRQSSYTPPYVTVEANAYWRGQVLSGTHVTSLYPAYAPGGTGSCYGGTGTVTGQHTFAGDLQNVRFNLWGNTFVGSSITYDDSDRIITNPY